MLGKLTIAVLAFSALFYALYRLARQKGAPDFERATGLRRRFLLATALCIAFLGGTVQSQVPESEVKTPRVWPTPPRPTCYKPAPFNQKEIQSKQKIRQALRAAWLVLDPQKGEEFQKLVEQGVKNKLLDAATAKTLSATYQATASHHWRTRGKGRMISCYDPMGLPIMPRNHAEKILKKIELLQQAVAKGKVPADVATKIESTLIREITILELAGELNKSFYDAKKTAEEKKEIREKIEKIKKEYAAEKLPASESATKAAKLIVEFETKEKKPTLPVEKKAP